MTPHLLSLNVPQKDKSCAYWPVLPGSGLSLAISEAAASHCGLSVAVTPDMQAAYQLEQELKFYAPELMILNFPDWETLPYDHFSPHQDIVSQRLTALYRLPLLRQGVLIVPIKTLMQRLPPPSYVQATTFVIKKGDILPLEPMRKRLESAGYRCVAQVIEHGEFAVRGAILDLYPAGSSTPYRIDLLDEEIDSIRTFDPDTQRSLEVVEHIELLPAREYPLTEDAIACFRQQWRTRFTGNPANCPLYQDISQGASAVGAEYYLPLFFAKTVSLFDYVPASSAFFLTGDLMPAANQFWTEIQERYEQLRHDVTKPLLAPVDVFLPANEIFQHFNTFRQIRVTAEQAAAHCIQPPDLAINSKSTQPLAAIEKLLNQNALRVLFCAETPGRREALLELLKKIHITPKIISSWHEFIASDIPAAITVAPLERGLALTEPAIHVIAETQLFGQQVLQRRRRRIRQQETADAAIKNLAELNIGAPVVHIEHGVGRYLGLQTLQTGNYQAEYLTLAYAGNDKLYVPVASLHLISRYSGADPEHAPLHKLGSEQWQKAKRKAAEQVRDVAAELLDIHARRAARTGYAFSFPEEHYQAFAAAFPFEETPDQAAAIENVIQDMTSGKSMDRLVCGDVGFGKTEVAMRAAFIAVQDGKQVAILVPTTLLAQQHYQNFTDRFADWPIRIEVISRFRSAKQQQAIIEQLQAGTLDILIGTHKLLQQGVQFSRLGLVIIDEEHRFGVHQKEALKKLRAEVDILTLTATPIPRTLNMSLAGLRDLSIIATPPSRRLSVKTFVRERNNGLIREAMMREILRGGQVFYLHNDVETIARAAQELAEFIPEARISIGHGQMRERELEQVMADFYHHRSNVLVCTTIIETGIDIPSANTIIIERADKFGLAQLHQLRGRVGRSHHQAYAYLLTPPPKSMTADAVKRLDAIASLDDLGAGFTLATHDLEIRGAGELLGEEQSGNMQAIGFSLYMELLDRAVNALKSGKLPELDLTLQGNTEIELQIPALIPNDYIADPHIRLTLYKRIASAENQDQLAELQIEMIDRFGLLPTAAKYLFAITELKLAAKRLGIRKIDANANGGRIEFEEQPKIDPLKIIQLIQQQPQTYKLENAQRLRFTWDCTEPADRINALSALISSLRSDHD